MSSLDFDHDQNHEPYRADNQNGMNSLELSTPDCDHGLDYLNVKSVPMTNELDAVLRQLMSENNGEF